MTEMEPREEIDVLLRHEMAAPIPNLPKDFEQRVMRGVRRRSQPLDRWGRMLLAGYGVVSIITCAVILRGGGLDWAAVSGTIVGPLAVVAAGGWAWRAIRKGGKAQHRLEPPA